MEQESLDIYTHFRPKVAKTNKQLLRSSQQLRQCFYGQNVSESNAFDKYEELKIDQEGLDNTYTYFVPKEAKTNKTLLRSTQQLLSFYGQNVLQSNAFD